ncbi:hypothetical protein [Bounagaea algeriensis]
MRNRYEPSETDEFEAAKELLVRRCLAWADEQQLTADPFLLHAALDFRHTSTDGRLMLWTAELAEKFLLTWMPRKVSASAEEVSQAPDSLRTLVRYLQHTELAEATGDRPADIEAAISAAAAEFPRAMSDPRNFGIAKFWTMTAIDAGVDPHDESAMSNFIAQVHEGTVSYDAAALEHIMNRHFTGDDAAPGPAPAMPPVSLPSAEELAEAAENSTTVQQLRTLVSWLGHEGRSLTGTGQLKLADARQLVEQLGTGDTVDPVLGGRTYRTKSSAELAGLALLVAWAKKTRVARVVKNRLVPIAKAKPVLRDATALWNRAFDAITELDEAVLGSSPYGRGLPRLFYREVVPDVLRTLYGMPVAFPVVCLQESAWLTYHLGFGIEEAEGIPGLMRQRSDNDVWRILRVLADLGAVELTTGTADPSILAGLDVDATVDDGGGGLPPESRENLRAALDPEAGPIDLVRLTPLATARVHTWLVDEGRYAPLLGELSEVTPAQLLTTIAEQHPPPAARAEIDHWLSTHDSREPEQLVDAVRQCPFRSRAAAMLGVLSTARDDGTVLLRRLRSDDVLGPLALHSLLASELLDQDDLIESEQRQLLAEQLIQALETAGPETVQAMLAESAPDDPLNILANALHSGHPDVTGLNELRTLVAEPLQQQTSG